MPQPAKQAPPVVGTDLVLGGCVWAVARAPRLDRLAVGRRAARAAHHDIALLDDVLGTGVPVLIARDAAARIARTVERVDVPFLPRRRGFVTLASAQKPLPHEPGSAQGAATLSPRAAHSSSGLGHRPLTAAARG